MQWMTQYKIHLKLYVMEELAQFYKEGIQERFTMIIITCC